MSKIMLKLFTLILVIRSATSKVPNISTRIETSSRAIASIIEIMKEKYYIEFELIVLSDDKNLKTIANRIMSYSTTPLTMRFDDTFNNETRIFEISQKKSAIIISSHGQFTLKNLRLKENQLAYNQYLYIQYCPYETESGNFFSKVALINYYRLFNLAHTFDGNLTLIGDEMISRNSCTPITRSMNTFLVSEMKWKSSNFIPRYENFYGCNFNICAATTPVGIDLLFVNSFDYNGSFNGFAGYLLPFLKERFNFGKFHFIESRVLCNLCFIFYRFWGIETNEFHMTLLRSYVETYPVYHADYAFIVTKGLSYSPMEKLFLPFDLETWIMIIITFAVGFITIFIVYRCNRGVRRFVFGTFVTSPSFNLTSIFFGMGVTRLPGRNFARFLFMVFTLYCLIIRSAYQGKLFEFINKNVKKPTAKSAEDLIQMKIPVIKTEANMSLIQRDDEYIIFSFIMFSC